MKIEERLWSLVCCAWLHAAIHAGIVAAYRYLTLPLVFVLLPSSAFGQYESSHPGGSLDQWVHSANHGTVAVLASQASPALLPSSPPPATVHVYSSTYPTHSVKWHIVGSRESRHELIQHLTTEPQHADVRAVYTANDLHHMSRAQLQTIHDDSHERRAIVRYANMTDLISVQQPTTVTTYRTYQAISSCPGGVCPVQSVHTNRVRRSRRVGTGSGGLLGVGAQFGLINVSK